MQRDVALVRAGRSGAARAPASGRRVGAIRPLYVVLLAVLLIVASVPAVTLFLPGLFYD